MTSGIQKLQWDSQFFQMEIGKIELSEHFTESNLSLNLKNSNLDLIYVFSPQDINSLQEFFVEKKVDYKIELDKVNLSQTENGTSIFSSNLDTFEELENLAILSGEFSRYKTDKNFDYSSFISLYKKWIYNSVYKNYVEQIIVSKSESGQIIGFVSLKEINSKVLSINLISVDQNYQGLGIATKLISSSIYYAKIHGYKTLTVTTQDSNKAAKRLYNKNTFEISRIQFVYHYWNKI